MIESSKLDPIRVMIVDDQELFATSLQMVINGGSTGRLQVSGIAHDGAECLKLLETMATDVILMDVRMPGMDGVEATSRVHELYPHIHIMMLTTFDDDDYVKHAMQAGANGYVMKNIDADELIAYIFAISKGTHLMSPSIGNKYFGQSSKTPGAAGDKQQPAEKIDYLQTRFPDLKRREAEVLFHILQGLSNNQIAELLFISKNTVNNYTSTIYAKIGVDDRLHAIQLLGHIG